MLDSTDNQARERRARRLFEEQARRQGIPLLTEGELIALYPRGTDEEEEAFDQAMRELYEEKRRQRQPCEWCSGTRHT